MRQRVMGEDLLLIRTAYWEQDVKRSTLIKEVGRLICNYDYQNAKRWIEENLMGQTWFTEYKPKNDGRGRRGIMCRFGFPEEGDE